MKHPRKVGGFPVLVLAAVLPVVAGGAASVSPATMPAPAISVPVLAGVRDEITTTDGWVEIGEIVEDVPGGIRMIQANGHLWIPRRRFEPGGGGKIVMDYPGHARKILPDDSEAFHRLGILCEQYGMMAEALQAYQEAVKSTRPPPDALLALGRLFEAKKDWPGAVGAYRRFLRGNPARNDIVERLAAVEKSVSPTENPIAVEKPLEPVAPEKPADSVDGIEAGGGWVIQTWGNAAALTENTVAEPFAANKVLRVDFKKEGKDKVAIGKKIAVDLSGRNALSLNVFNQSDRPLGLALAIVTFPGYRYFESQPEIVSPGAWRLGVMYSLKDATFKSEASGWRYTQPIENLNDVREVILLIYHSTAEGALFVDQAVFAP